MLAFFHKMTSQAGLPKFPGVSPEQVQTCLESLQQNNIAPIPAAYQTFLSYCNGLAHQGAYLAGVFPQSDTLADLLRLNLHIHHPLAHDFIILGFNEMDYLGYNHKWQAYQLIDKLDFEVLEEYAEIEPALNHFLKI